VTTVFGLGSANRSFPGIHLTIVLSGQVASTDSVVGVKVRFTPDRHELNLGRGQVSSDFVGCSFKNIDCYWQVQFLEADLKTPLPRKLTFTDPEKIREVARRGEAWATQRAGRCWSRRSRLAEVGFT
jgi:hypothetical protein